MDHERTENGVRDPATPIPKDTLLVDLHHTLAVPAHDKPQGLLVYEETVAVLGQLTMGWRKLARLTRKARLKLENILPPEQRSGLAYYGLLNVELHRCDTEQGCEISRRLTTNPDLYEMSDQLRSFFTWLFEEKFPYKKTKLLLASNSDRQSVEALLAKIGMRRYFPSENIFTPDRFNGIGKSPRFFGDILQAAKVDPRRALHLGNSAIHDLYAALLMDVAWFRSPEETVSRKMLLQRLGAEALARILTIRKIESARALIDAKFVSAN